VPLYVRGGAILPEQPLVQSTDETPGGPLQLRVYPGKDCHGSLYEDDGHTFEYKSGKFLRINYSCEATKLSVRVSSQVVTNGFRPWWHGAELTVLGLQSKPHRVQLEGGKDPEWSYDAQTSSATIAVTDALRGWTIHILR
jgi:alpha-glucosidase